jgi:hypothetical protein
MSMNHSAFGSAGCLQTGRAASLERARYFARQLLSAADLTADQQYVQAKLRRHNRLLHGWGVVCGAGVRAVPGKEWTVVVEPGYLLGPQGDEILIDDCTEVDLSRQGLDGNAASPCVDPIDPWCSSVRVDRRVGQRLFVAAAYAECPSRPVRVQPAGCGCDDAGCEYSRTRDGFMLRVLTALPDSYARMKPPVRPYVCPPGGVRACPDCLDDPWVLLAAVRIKSSKISDNDIDNVTYRRHVISFAGDYQLCGPKILSFILKPDTVIAGVATEGHLTLDKPAPPGGSYIELESSDPASATLANSATIEEGQTTTAQPIPIATSAPGPGGDVILTASLLGSLKSATLHIVTLKSLEFDRPFVPAGSTAQLIAKLSAPAPVDLPPIAVTVDNPAVAPPPAPLVFAPNTDTLRIPIATTATPGQATFMAMGPVPKPATLGTWSLRGLDLEVRKTLAGREVAGRVQFAGRTGPGLSVALAVTRQTFVNRPASDADVVGVPATLPVPDVMDPVVTFTLAANRGGTAVVTAEAADAPMVEASVAVVGMTQFRVMQADFQVGSGSDAIVSLNDNPPDSDADVAITAPRDLVDVPESVTIPVAATQQALMLRALAAGDRVTVTASLGLERIDQVLRIRRGR